jgi:hypothetical protein
VFLVLTLCILIWQFTPIATAVANRQLPTLLRTDASVDQVKLKPWEGYAAVRGLRIAQPAGFGEEPLLELDRLEIRLDVDSAVGRNPLVVTSVDLDGLRARVIKKADGSLNVEAIGPPQEPAPASPTAEPAAPSPPSSTPPTEAAPAPPLPGLRLDRLTLNHIALTYVDESLGSAEKPIEFKIADLEVALEQLVAFDPSLAKEPATLRAQARIEQPNLPPALVHVESRIGGIGHGVPEVNGQIVLTGILLETFGSLAPPGISAAIGGSGADVTVSVALNARTIDLEGRVVTDQGNKYPLSVKGPLAKPAVEMGPLLLSLAGRIGGGMAKHLASGTAEGAMNLAKGTAGEAVSLSKDAGDAAKEATGGLFRSASSLLRGDVQGVGKGLKDATVGTATQAAGGVKESVGDMAGVAVETGGDITGSERSQDWIKAISGRHAEATRAASEALADMPWPPPPASPPKTQPAEAKPAA